VKRNSRAEARALGLPRYFTGKLCKHGHIAERYTATYRCQVCDRIQIKAKRDVRNAKEARRRALKSGVGSECIPSEWLTELLATQDNECALTEVPFEFLDVSPHLDHKVPIARGGPHARKNVQYLTPQANIAKGTQLARKVVVRTGFQEFPQVSLGVVHGETVEELNRLERRMKRKHREKRRREGRAALS
jgi:5-methylcytosine-specific restriction endonuclease McrA